MDMLEIIRAAAKRKRPAPMQSPIGEFAVLGLLLAGVQLGVSNALPNAPMAQTDANTVVEHHADSLTPIAQLVDLINPDKVEPVVNTAVANISDPPVKLASPATKQKSLTVTNSQYHFAASLGSTISRLTRANLFQADALPENALAIWDINKRFALANKNVKKSAKTARAKQRKSNNKFVVMIDPGHGGSDPGSIGHNGLQEKVLTLDIARRAQALLADLGNVSVLLTRDDDTGMSRKTRVHKVKRSNADMVVSLHLNHLPQTDVNLVETFYAAPHNILESIEKQRSAESNNGMIKTKVIHNHDLSFTKGSRKLAAMMQQRVFNEVANNNPDTDNAGVKQDTLYILTRSFTPGVLIEMSCLSNIREAERLTDAAYRNKLAAALANGIRDYLSTPAAKSHLGPEV